MRDAIASAEWLVANKVSSPEKLSIMGGSAGGIFDVGNRGGADGRIRFAYVREGSEEDVGQHRSWPVLASCDRQANDGNRLVAAVPVRAAERKIALLAFRSPKKQTLVDFVEESEWSLKFANSNLPNLTSGPVVKKTPETLAGVGTELSVRKADMAHFDGPSRSTQAID